jgi:hypothetical protein
VKARLTVRLEDSDFFEIGHAARARGLSVAEWVRRALRTEVAEENRVQAKLHAVRQAVRHSAPTADIGQMLDEIAQGAIGEIPSKGE